MRNVALGTQVGRRLAGRTGAGEQCQANHEVLLGEAAAAGPFRPLGAQRAVAALKCLVGVAIPACGIGNPFGYRQARFLLTLVDQGQSFPRMQRIGRQDGHGRD